MPSSRSALAAVKNMRCSAMRMPSRCRERRAPGQPGGRFGGLGDRNHRREREFQPRRPPADQPRDLGQHVGQQHVFAAENVALADGAASSASEMAGGDVVDMHEVQSGIEEAGHRARVRLRR